MPRIMINCFKTGQAVSTGMVIDRDAWIKLPADWEGDRFLCAACDTMHAWIKRDAFLDVPEVTVPPSAPIRRKPRRWRGLRRTGAT